MAAFRGRKCSCGCKCKFPTASRDFQQGCCLLFVLGTSFAVLFIVMNVNDELACDYTDVVDSCSDQPFYRTSNERNNSLINFHTLWLMKAQDIRNETEVLKCETEKKLMEDLTSYHHSEAKKIIERCHDSFQQCVNDMRTEGSWTTSTSTTTTTTTLYVFVKGTTINQKSRCQQYAETIGKEGTTSYLSAFLNCQTGMVDLSTPTAAPASMDMQQDCTLCDSFCRAFNWTQLDPEYAMAMNYTKWSCGAKVCPWIPECGSATASMNVHRNCSAKGCPCERATCLGGTPPPGGRRVAEAAPTAPPGDRRVQAAALTTTTQWSRGYASYTTTTTYESLENNTNCTCKPGLVDTVLVGRPFKVFFGDPATMLRRRRTATTMAPTEAPGSTTLEPGAPSGGRRLDDGFDEVGEEEFLDEDQFEARQLSMLYKNLNSDVAHLQGVHIEMEEEIIIGRDREFGCRNYFSDRYRYVWPKTLGDIHSLEAMIARQSHPDLGCGYQGDFKVTCGNEILTDNETGESYDTGNCTYKVDISTCEPPTYEQALDSCFAEESWSSGPMFIPEVKPFLQVEDLNLTVAGASDSNEIPPFDQEQCCEVYVGSECVENFNHTNEFASTVEGVWEPEKSYKRDVGYFPRVECSQQAALRHRSCPRVKINKISRAADDPILRPCRKACNLTYARQELQNLCVQESGTGTYERELKGLKDKVAHMTVKRAELERWARQQWPLVGKTEHVLDCVEDQPNRRFNQMGWAGLPGWIGVSDGYDLLKIRYQCRMQGCKENQCVKVTNMCPIPQMEAKPEAMCGPFGDQNTYMCIDKKPFETWGVISRPIGYGWLALSMVCFLASFLTCFQEFCMAKKNKRVHPYRDKMEEEVRRCDKCNSPLDTDALDEGSTSCTQCILASQLPDVCRNCGQEYEEEDEYCSNCRQPRAMAALTDGGTQVCMRCGAPMDLQDAKCLECNWRPEDAIVLKADCTPLRANANSAANESRIVPADLQLSNVVGHE